MPSAASGVTLAVPLTVASAALPDGGTVTFPRRPALAGMAAGNVATHRGTSRTPATSRYRYKENPG